MKVLYVDDDTGLLAICKEFLERSNHLMVDTVGSAQDALSRVRETAYDVIISDYQMPGMSGIDLLKELRNAGHRTPFILFTGKGREELAAELRTNDPILYLQKGGDALAQFAELEHQAKQAVARYRSDPDPAPLGDLKEPQEGTRGLEGRLKAITDGAVRTFGADLAWIWMIRTPQSCEKCRHADPPEGTAGCGDRSRCLHLMARSGRYAPISGEHGRVPLGQYEIGRITSGENAHPITADGTPDRRSREMWTEDLGPVTSMGYRLTSREGRTIGALALLRTTPFRADEARLLEGLAETTAQVIARWSAEAALGESEEKFRNIFNNAQDAIVILDLEGGILEVNDRIVALSGFSREELLRMGLQDLFRLEPASKMGDPFKLLCGKGQARLETKFLAGNGRPVPVEVHAKPIMYGGRPAILSNARDISGQKVTEAELASSKLKMTVGMDLARLAHWEYDILADQFYFDDRFYALYGTDGEMEQGHYQSSRWYVTEFVAPDDRERVSEFIEYIHGPENTNDYPQIEHRIVRRDGEVRHIIVRIGLIRDATRRPIKTFGVNQDVTELKLAEEGLRKANEKLNLLNNITRHDMTNQLTILYGTIALAKDAGPGSGVAPMLARMEKCAQVMSSHIDFTRTYQDLGTSLPQWQDMEGLIRSLPVSGEIEHLDLRGLRGVSIYADPMLPKVFHNLFEDSIRYGGRPTNVRLGREMREGQLVLAFEDAGPGIPVSDKEHIFIKGFGKGTGLGLFLSREILAITGITITETGCPGKGVRFELAVPRGNYRVVPER
jgi:PAS domain S-box-containing protein